MHKATRGIRCHFLVQFCVQVLWNYLFLIKNVAVPPDAPLLCSFPGRNLITYPFDTLSYEFLFLQFNLLLEMKPRKTGK